MIESVARAICDGCGSDIVAVKCLGKGTSAQDAARAAILAMREPTKEMINEGAWEDNELLRADYNVPRIWRAMIDAALK